MPDILRRAYGGRTVLSHSFLPDRCILGSIFGLSAATVGLAVDRHGGVSATGRYDLCLCVRRTYAVVAAAATGCSVHVQGTDPRE